MQTVFSWPVLLSMAAAVIAVTVGVTTLIDRSRKQNRDEIKIASREILDAHCPVNHHQINEKFDRVHARLDALTESSGEMRGSIEHLTSQVAMFTNGREEAARIMRQIARQLGIE